ncbi:MAG: AI-2E family transporter [Blastocatellia bacterium]|nr:AI-2E family transporter [Blastocatellia bacterium]
MSSLRSSQFWWIRWVPAGLIAVLALVVLVRLSRPILVPFLVSIALVYMMEPFVEWFERRKLSRNLSVLAAMTTATLGVILLVGVLLPSIWHQLQESIRQVPLALQAGSELARNGLDYLETHVDSAILARVREAMEGVANDPSAITTTVGEWLMGGFFGIVNLGSTALGLLIVPFFVYYLLVDLHDIRRGFDRRIPDRFRVRWTRLADDLGTVMRGYVRGRFLVAIGMSLTYAIGLWIVGVPLWAGIGLIAGFLGIIPYLGVMSGAVLALAFAALSGASLAKLGGVVVVFIIAQIVEDYVLTPKLIGDRLALHPMLVFIALIIGGELFGLLGLVLAIPVLAGLKVVFSLADAIYRDSEFFRTGESPLELPAPTDETAPEPSTC